MVSASTRGHFPLKDCRGEDTDILTLLNDHGDYDWVEQGRLMKNLIRQFFFTPFQYSYSSNWKGASVLHQINAHIQFINVSDWSFRRNYDFRKPYLHPNVADRQTPIPDLRALLTLKIQIVERLFEEMSGVRKNAIRVGVVFLDGTSLTQEEIMNVPSIVNEKNSTVKIFVTVFGNELVEEILLLADTIVLPNRQLSKFSLQLLLAMCGQCGRGWTPFKHKLKPSMVSCIQIKKKIYFMTWTSALDACNEFRNCHLPVIQTLEELILFEENLNGILNKQKLFDGQFPIGLRTDSRKYANRFQWVTTPGRHRPLLIQNWLRGKPPTVNTGSRCVMWQFARNLTNDQSRSNLSQDGIPDKYSRIHGWVDVGCDSIVATLLVCEVVLPPRLGDAEFIRLAQAPEETFVSTLNKGHFVKFQGNIVSMSANVGNQEFRKFLRDSKKEFPIFDCGEDAGDPRYISYSMVCDFVDQCINRRDEITCLKPRNIPHEKEFYCASGQIRPLSSRCDNVKDCSDGSDEVNCFDYPCNSVRCVDGSCLPLQWLNDGELDCFTYKVRCDINETDESSLTNIHLMTNKSCALICNRDSCIRLSQLNDTTRDCTGPEGPLDETIGKLEPANTCRNLLGDFIWAPRCHYIRDRYGGIIGCRDLSHLELCENFRCGQGYAKCPHSYCIPQHYLRDGTADCPSGEDENPINIGTCAGNFVCGKSQICLHLDLVCDGHPDCPFDGDDERDCHGDCPSGFRCIAGTLTVFDYNRSVPLDMTTLYNLTTQYTYLDLSGVVLNELNRFILFTQFKSHNLQTLILSKCNISDLFIDENYEYFQTPIESVIKKLDISYNMIHELFKYKNDYTKILEAINYLNVSFNGHLTSVYNLNFRFLEILDLSFTSISYLNESVFIRLPKLKHLNLSHTLISDFSRPFFPTKLAIHSLDLRGILTKDFQDYFFHGLEITQTLYTDHFQVCCPQTRGLIIPPHACVAPVNAISSCFHLIGLDVQRVLLWDVAVLAVVGNATVVLYRIIWDRKVLKVGYGLFVTNLGISDFIMGIYLSIIAGADYVYRDNYVLHDKDWRRSIVCKCAGFLACLSCETSTFFIFLITVDRFLALKFPFGQIKLSTFTKTCAVTVSWVASFLLSLVPIVFNYDLYSSNAMCLGLPLTKTHVAGWEYSVGVFVIFNFFMFLFIACGQYAIYRAMAENRISNAATNTHSSRRAEDITVAKQLSLVALTDFLCWFPVGLMGLLSLEGREVSNEVYAWTTVFLLPINSAVNPVIYTIPAIMNRWEKFKQGH